MQKEYIIEYQAHTESKDAISRGKKALYYLFSEQNMIGESLLLKMAKDLELDTAYMSHTLSDNRHPVSFEQGALL